MKKVVAVGAALLLLYAALTLLTPTQQPQPPTSTPQPTPAPRDASTGREISPTPPSQQESQREMPPTTPSQPQPAGQQIGDASPKETPRPREAPKLTMWINASDVATTRLPIVLNYTVYIRNEGQSPVVLALGDITIELKGGETYRLDKSLLIDKAGIYEIREELQGLVATTTVKVLYYAPRLEALPVEIEVDKLPAEVVINVTVRNRGNYTGRIGHYEIPPGAELKIRERLVIQAAGVYTLSINGLQTEVRVTYRYARVVVEVPEREFEIVPGETVEVPIVLTNVGNATATAKVEGTRVEIPPASRKVVTHRLASPAAGTYRIKIETEDAAYYVDVKITTISYSVQIAVISPFTKAGYMRGTYQKDVVEFRGDSVEITWRPTVYTNATRRAITLEVDGRSVRLEPGRYVDLEPRTISTKVPSTVRLSVSINGTVYTLELELKRPQPALEIIDVSRIVYMDRRPVETRLSCRGIGDINIVVQMAKADIDFTRGTLSGEVRVRAVGEEFTFRYAGSFAAGRGTATISGVPIYGEIYVEFETDPPRILSARTKNGEPVPCTFPNEILPAALRKPRGTNRLDLAIRMILNNFAKGTSDRIYKVEIKSEGETVAEDIGGRTLEVKLRESAIKISGPLDAEIYGQFRIIQ